MADVLISSELLVDDVQIDSGLNSSSIDIDTDIGSTTIIQTEAVKAYATEEEDGVLLTVIDFYGTTTGLVHNGEKGEQGEQGEQGIQGETGAAAGFGTVSASVDSNVGTPSVEVTTSGTDTSKNFSFAFHNLKGQQGEQGIQGIQGIQGETGQTGATGAAAGFGTVTATVDANVGTPSVEVSTSGTDTAKNFAFAFHNLKGQKGETGDGVPSGGTDGQLLSKTSSGTAWIDPPSTDDHKWNDVTLNKANSTSASDIYVPTLGTSTSATTAYLVKGSNSPTANVLAKYDGDKYLKSTTPTSSDSSTKVATTAFVATALSGITFPVTSVNGQTGAVSLSIPSAASDVGAIADPSTKSNGQVLTYNGSSWVAQTPSSSADIYYVELGGTVNWANVVAAHNANKLIVGYFTSGTHTDCVPLATINVGSADGSSQNDFLIFNMAYNSGSTLGFTETKWTGGGTGWTGVNYTAATQSYVDTAIGTAIGNSY